MEDPREYVTKKLHSLSPFKIHSSYKNKLRDSIASAIIHTIADYVQTERVASEIGMGALEQKHSYPQAFFDCEDPEVWLNENRQPDDKSLVMYVYDNIGCMKQGVHRRTLMYLINILHFDL